MVGNSFEGNNGKTVPNAIVRDRLSIYLDEDLVCSADKVLWRI